MSKIRVLYLITSLGKGGAERSITDLCLTFLMNPNIECVIGVLYPVNDFSEATNKLNVYFLDHKPNRLFKRSYTQKYHDLISSFKPHIIHSNLFMAEFLTLESLHKDILYVCHGRDNMIQFANLSFNTILRKRLLLNFYEKQLLVHKKYRKYKSYFVVNSTDTYHYFCKTLPSNFKKNISIIHNAIQNEKFANCAVRSVNSSQTIRIINVGSFQAKKNQIFLVDIAKELLKQNLKFEIHLLGDGEKRAIVETEVKKSGLINSFKFHGNVTDVENHLKNSDIYIHTAWYEPFGIVFLEAMASGLPIVALDGKGNRDIIHDNENGFLIMEQNPKLFAEKISLLINDPILYERLSKAGQKFAQKFDIKNKALEYYDYYRSLLIKEGLWKAD